MAGSIESVPSQFHVSLREAGIDNLLEFLSKKEESEVRFRQRQQRGDPELSPVEKLLLLRQKLDKSPGSFLNQFGRYLQPSHLDCFNSIRNENYEVDFYLKQMEVSTRARKMEIKNRRYEALQRLVDTTDYFTEEEMQRRNPILFTQLIGKYHTKEEREAFLFQSSKSSSSSTSGPSSNPTPLTDMLIAHMSRHEGICSERRLEQEHQVQEEMQADKEYLRRRPHHEHPFKFESDDSMKRAKADESDCDEEEDDEMDEEVLPEIDESEKDLLKEEFFTTMYRHFLEGKDEDFEYTSVDDNPEYDSGETLEQDEEEKYFDSEQPENSGRNEHLDIHEESDLDQEMKAEDTKVSKDNNSVFSLPTPHIVKVDDEEDELDAYMRTIEVELKRQNEYT